MNLHCFVDFVMLINPYKPCVLFIGHGQTMTRQRVASDQGLHCLLIECSINI